MNKLQLLRGLADNMEIMHEIERIIDKTAPTAFQELLIVEWHELQRENGDMIQQIKSLLKKKTSGVTELTELDTLLHHFEQNIKNHWGVK